MAQKKITANVHKRHTIIARQRKAAPPAIESNTNNRYLLTTIRARWAVCSCAPSQTLGRCPSTTLTMTATITYSSKSTSHIDRLHNSKFIPLRFSTYITMYSTRSAGFYNCSCVYYDICIIHILFLILR